MNESTKQKDPPELGAALASASAAANLDTIVEVPEPRTSLDISGHRRRSISRVI